MDPFWKAILLRQFIAVIEMFTKALVKCPDDVWTSRMWMEGSQPAELSAFWYVAYHALFWLDLYLTGSLEGFAPPPPFSLSELDPRGLLPDRVYAKAELLDYVTHNRQKCETIIKDLTDEQAHRTCSFPWGEVSFAELILYNMRHVQEHAAQLNMFLGQQTGSDSRWIAGS